MRKLLFRGRNAARIAALYYISKPFRQPDTLLFADNAVPYNIDGRARIYVAEKIKVNIEFGIDLYDILSERCR